MSVAAVSLSPVPRVTSGKALAMPFVPVVAVTPTPWRLNQASTVKAGRCSFAGLPNETYALVPPKSIAWLLGLPVGFTVIVASSELVSAPSLAVSRRTYAPATEKLAVVVGEVVSPKVTTPGPLILVQATVRVGGLGSPSSVTDPFKSAWAGNVMS